MDKKNHIFGPVPSRRLGLSLGIDIVPMKTCSLSCIYCQVGKTPHTTISRQEYVSAREILTELEDLFNKGIRADWITFSGSGEPTLNSAIGEIITGIKALTNIPVCVITNGTLLWDTQVCRDVLESDAVMPSLDSAIEQTFHAICRPHPDLKIGKIIEGLVDFRKMYSGKIWLEILLVEGINDSPEELEALCEAAMRISPDTIQLNTVVRPPAEISAKPVSRERLEKIRDFFGVKAEIIASFKSPVKNYQSLDLSCQGSERSNDLHALDSKTRHTFHSGVREKGLFHHPLKKNSVKSDKIKTADVVEYLKRRPGSIEDISAALSTEKSIVEKIIETLSKSGEIRINEFSGKLFWEYVNN